MTRTTGGLRIVLAGALVLAVAGCSAPPPGQGLGSERGALDAITALGVDCSDYTGGQVDAVPYTVIRCAGLQIEWTADVASYSSVRAADCEATPMPERAAYADIVVVVGPDWLLRGSDSDTWPASLTPDAAAQRLGGEVKSMADYCVALGAWA